MQNQDTIFRELNCLALLNKLSEQLGILINENNDSRFRNLATQAYTMKQDLEDKIREDNIDGDIDIKSAPNIPTPTKNNVNSSTNSNSNSSKPNTNTTSGSGDDEDDDLNNLLSSAISSITGKNINLDDEDEDDEDDELPFN